MTKLENHHFVILNEMTDSAKNHQWSLETFREELMGKLITHRCKDLPHK